MSEYLASEVKEKHKQTNMDVDNIDKLYKNYEILSDAKDKSQVSFPVDFCCCWDENADNTSIFMFSELLITSKA